MVWPPRTAFGDIFVSQLVASEFLTCLWELSDGTQARVVEHGSSPRWELCVIRRGRVVQRQRCRSVDELMAASTALYAAATVP